MSGTWSDDSDPLLPGTDEEGNGDMNAGSAYYERLGNRQSGSLDEGRDSSALRTAFVRRVLRICHA